MDDATRRERKREYLRDYRERNRQRILDQAKAYREAHAAEVSAYKREWRQRESGRVKAQKAMDRARRLGVELAVVEYVDLDTVWERDGGRCYICGEPADPETWEIDHLVPLYAGGDHTYLNIGVTDPTCNRRKWRSDPRTDPRWRHLLSVVDERRKRAA